MPKNDFLTVTPDIISDNDVANKIADRAFKMI